MTARSIANLVGKAELGKNEIPYTTPALTYNIENEKHHSQWYFLLFIYMFLIMCDSGKQLYDLQTSMLKNVLWMICLNLMGIHLYFFSYYVLYLYITIYFSPKLGNQTFSPLLGCLSYTLLEKNPGNWRASSPNKERCVCFTEEIRAV